MEKSTVEPAKMFDYKIEGVDMEDDITKKNKSNPDDIDDCDSISSGLLFSIQYDWVYSWR